MKYLFLLLLLISGVCYGQTTYYIQADSVRFRKIGGNSEFILENATRAKTGAYLKNRWNGRIEFGWAVDSVWLANDTIYFKRGTADTTKIPSGGGGSTDNVNIGTGFRLLKPSTQEIKTITSDYGTIFNSTSTSIAQSNAAPYKSNPSFHGLTPYATAKQFTKITQPSGFTFTDGGGVWFKGDTCFLLGGYNGSTITDSIKFITKAGSYGNYHIKLPIASSNHQVIRAKKEGDWNYIQLGTNLYRWKTLDNFVLVNNSLPFSFLSGMAQDNDGNIWVIAGQTNNSDTLSITQDVYFSSAQSGGASFTMIQDNLSHLGGYFTNAVEIRDEWLYVFNSLNKMDPGNHAYSNRTYRYPVSTPDKTDESKWERLEDAPAVLGNSIFIAAALCPDDGNIWVHNGYFNPGGNAAGGAYLDKYGTWHTFSPFTGMDSTASTTIDGSHAKNWAFNYDGSWGVLFGGNNSNSIYFFKSTSFAEGLAAKKYFQIHNTGFLTSSNEGEHIFLGRYVKGGSVSSGTFMRIAAAAPYVGFSSTGGFAGVLNSANSTLNTEVTASSIAHPIQWDNVLVTIGHSSLAGSATQTYQGNGYQKNDGTTEADIFRLGVGDYIAYGAYGRLSETFTTNSAIWGMNARAHSSGDNVVKDGTDPAFYWDIESNGTWFHSLPGSGGTTQARTDNKYFGINMTTGGMEFGSMRFFQGTGSPEGSVTAPVGSVYFRTDGGTGTTFYVKESGAGNTGWVAVLPYTNLTQFVAQNNWKVFYSDGSGDVQELSIGAAGTVLKSNGASSAPSFQNVLTEIGLAISDETTDLTTGTAKITFRMPYAMTVTAVRANINTVSSSGTPTFDINESGTTILSTKITIDASEKTSQTAATAPVISDATLADDAEITIDIDVAGTGAKGAKIWIIGYRN